MRVTDHPSKLNPSKVNAMATSSQCASLVHALVHDIAWRCDKWYFSIFRRSPQLVCNIRNTCITILIIGSNTTCFFGK